MAYLTIDAGGTFLKSAVLDSEGVVIQNSTFSVDSNSSGSAEEILSSFKEAISRGVCFVNGLGISLVGIAIAIPGPFDIRKAISLMTHKFQSIYGANLREMLYSISGLSNGIPIQFVQDANAVLIGELWNGNAKGYKNPCVVTLGTGLGFALSNNGIIKYNEIGGPQVSIFRLPFQQGYLEDYTAQHGILKMYMEISKKKERNGVTVLDLGEMAKVGDNSSILTFSNVGRILGKSLVSTLEENKVDCILFGGQISKSYQFMEKSVITELQNVKYLKKIGVVKNIDSAAMYGAFQSLKGYLHKVHE